MVSGRRLLAVVGVGALCACSDVNPMADDAGVLGDGGLEAVLESIRATHNVPSLAAAVVLDGSIAESGAVGLRAVDASEVVTTADRWHLGSLTKAMTGTLVGVLVEDGLLTWETTVAEVFPDLVGKIHSEYETVRVEELLHHTAGLLEDVTRAPSWSSLRTDGDPIVDSRLRFAIELLSFPPEAARGTYLYTNAGYVVVGAMLERLTGSFWEDLVTSRVFGPLGMTSTGFGAPGQPGVLSQPRGHEPQGGSWIALEPGFDADNPPQLGPAGTVHSTIEDYARFIRVHLDGARGISGLVSTDTWSALHTPAPGTEYAGGWGVTDHPWAHGLVLQHTGTNTVWFAGAVLAPARNIGLMAFTNAGGDAAGEATDEAVRALMDRVGW